MPQIHDGERAGQGGTYLARKWILDQATTRRESMSKSVQMTLVMSATEGHSEQKALTGDVSVEGLAFLENCEQPTNCENYVASDHVNIWANKHFGKGYQYPNKKIATFIDFLRGFRCIFHNLGIGSVDIHRSNKIVLMQAAFSQAKKAGQWVAFIFGSQYADIGLHQNAGTPSITRNQIMLRPMDIQTK